MKENRKIEELILMFVSTAHNSLKKNKQLAEGDAWKLELNNQISQFIRILRDSLRLCAHVPPELTAKMNTYAERLVPTPTDAGSDSGYASSTNGAGPSTPSVMFASVSEMPMVQAVGRLFGYEDHKVQTDLGSLRKLCTAKVCNPTPTLWSKSMIDVSRFIHLFQGSVS